MATPTYSDLEKRYRTALRQHLAKGCSLRSMQLLGRRAASCGLDVLALARLHDKTLQALKVARPSSTTPKDKLLLAQADTFFYEVLAPVESRREVVKASTVKAKAVDAQLERSTKELIIARQRERKALAQCLTLEKQLERRVELHKDVLLKSRRQQEQSRHLVHRLLQEQEECRKGISRELHDEVLQILAGINVQLATLKAAVRLNRSGLRQRIIQVQRMVGKSVRSVRDYARTLRPPLLDDLGLIPTMRSYIKELPSKKKLTIRFSAFPEVETLDNIHRTVLYRVCQEAITNVVRHAHAQNAAISIRKSGSLVCLEVRDDGKAFDVDRVLASNTKRGLGLIGMRERLEMIGGSFSICSETGKGTVIYAQIPFRKKIRRPTA